MDSFDHPSYINWFGDESDELMVTASSSLSSQNNNDETRRDNDPSTSSWSPLERTIHVMQQSQVCASPAHGHSFQYVNFSMSLKTCAGCASRIQTVTLFGMGSSSDPSQQVVRCLSCGAWAHRRCATDSGAVRWNSVCSVNAPRIQAAMECKSCPEEASMVLVEEGTLSLEEGDEEIDEKLDEEDQNDENDEQEEEEGKEKEVPPAPAPLEWTLDGPPQHWAGSKSPFAGNFVQSITVPSEKDSSENGAANDASEDDDEQVHITPLHYAHHPFASVSRALQENIVAHFRPRAKGIAHQVHGFETIPATPPQPLATDASTMEADMVRVIKGGNQSSNPQSTAPRTPHPLVQFASGTYEAVRTSVNMPRRLGMASVAGGLAGGVAGLAIAGPAGALAGCRLGQTAGALGVILEGSVSIGVFVASVAGGVSTANRIKDEIHERRILTMGEEGIARKVLLVRPQILIDPEWEELCAEAKRKAPAAHNTLGSFMLLPSNDTRTRERHLRDDDIIQPSEDELATADKVLLLASRILNDKLSLPGHVYRSLIETFRGRCRAQEGEEGANAQREENEEGAEQQDQHRIRRDDAHAVIKHVTATLLEVRPDLGASPATTELTATAVESLVFGEIFDLVFLEITTEARELDAALQQKIQEFERNYHGTSSLLSFSEDASKALQMLPTAHSAVDKLSHCVTFLERISDHFSGGSGRGLCAADSLLKMVCQHVLVAHLDQINAEVAFLEEFARDEQLLRGKEGYSLVTLQAALHFLNMSTDVEKDIFWQDTEEDNVPVQPSAATAESCSALGTANVSKLDGSGELI